MTPIERVRAKVAAAEILGVGQHAETEEIRAAWHRAARAHHPDQSGGDNRMFVRARAAYEFLSDGQGGEAILPGRSAPVPERRTAARPPSMRRPILAARVTQMEPDDYLDCVALLNATPQRSATDHVPMEVIRSGRELTFSVSAPLEKGVNRVAVPTTLIVSSPRNAPVVLTFASDRAGMGEVEIPDAIRLQKFPGARVVRIRFGKE